MKQAPYTTSKDNEDTLSFVSLMLDMSLSDHCNTAEHMTSCFAKLTPELAEHIISMTLNTSDEKWLENEPCVYYEVMDEYEQRKWREHIGETIKLTKDGEPYSDVMQDESFPKDVRIDFAEDYLQDSIYELKSILMSLEPPTDPVPYYFENLKEAILLYKANGHSDEQTDKYVKSIIKKLFKEGK